MISIFVSLFVSISSQQQNCRTIFVTSSAIQGGFGGVLVADSLCTAVAKAPMTVSWIRNDVIAGRVSYIAWLRWGVFQKMLKRML